MSPIAKIYNTNNLNFKGSLRSCPEGEDHGQRWICAGTFRTWRDVRLESVKHSKADVD
jgi:hypothetical protein